MSRKSVEQNFDRWMSTKMYARAQNCPETGQPTTGTRPIGFALSYSLLTGAFEKI